MCGIFGISTNKDFNHHLIMKFINSLNHRGPDDNGYFKYQSNVLGMTRLSIQDVSNGNQPMYNAKKNLCIVFNGEIYNHLELRLKLESKGFNFVTNSDTETILKGFEYWKEDILFKLRGMYAFAIFNKFDNSIFIARDRIGIKPLYYYNINNEFVFSSELKTILLYPSLNKEIEQTSIYNYLSLRYVPGNNTMFKTIKKFPAGCFGYWKNKNLEIKRYWHYRNENKWEGNFNEAQLEFNSTFDKSVNIRMLSERPVGAFLSGGIDSTAIVSSISKQTSTKLNTFSVGFDWKGDELKIAAETAKKLNTEHHEVICNIDDTKLLPKIMWHLDEPIGDGIILPMHLLSKLASHHVTVVQSGEGADEILGGYLMHKIMYMSSIYTKLVPQKVDDFMINPLLKRLPVFLLNLFFDYPGSLGNDGKNKFIRFFKLTRSNNKQELFEFLISLFEKEEMLKLVKSSNDNIMNKKNFDFKNGNILDFQYDNWLPDDILCKLDKLTMANSIEGRVPFMDHKLVELVNSFPLHYKLKLFKNKIPIRNYLKNNNQSKISNMKKKAFYIPIDDYLKKGFLFDLFNDFLSEKSVKKRGLLDIEVINDLKKKFDGNSFVHGKKIFSLIMLELWFRIYVDNEKGWV